MARFFVLRRLAAAIAVILVQQPGMCWAAGTTGQGVSTTLYAGGGQLEEPNNEGNAAKYDEWRAGFGGVGVVRFRGAGSELGGFALLGGSFELERLRRTVCGYGCEDEPAEASFHSERHFAGRANIGYSFELVELRGGVLVAIPDPNARLSELLIIPDVAVRLGRRSQGWFELGLGAYDASTSFRPGVYAGAAYGPLETLRVSAHFGLHLPNGLCCSTLPLLGLRSELGLERVIAKQLRLAVGVAAYDSDVFEGSTRLSILL